MTNNYIYTVEWSEKQQCFHVDSLDSIIRKNLDLFFSEINSEYVLIGVFRSHEEAHKFISSLRSKRSIPTMYEKLELAQKESGNFLN
jgi:hypothetical protein